MSEVKMKIGKLFIQDLETGKIFEFDRMKPIDFKPEHEPEPECGCPFENELEEPVPDGISIYITGTEIDRIDNVSVYFKDKEGDK